MSVLPDSLGGWIAIAVLVFWFVGAYNRLVRLRSAALQAYANLDAALVRQIDFVQTHLAQPREPAPTREEAAAIVSLRAAAAQLTTLMGVTRLRPLAPTNMAALTTALTVLVAGWQRLNPDATVLFDADGTLSRPAPLDDPGGEMSLAVTAMPIAWPEPSAAAEIARSHFNVAVAHYNAGIAQFPAALVAWLVRLHRAAPLL